LGRFEKAIALSSHFAVAELLGAAMAARKADWSWELQAKLGAWSLELV
jgi:hypothetical protein